MNSWERQENESEEWFARFVIFLSMGHARTLSRAYKAAHPDSTSYVVSSAWRQEYKDRRWRSRATEFDLTTFKQDCREAMVVMGRSMRAFARKTLRSLLSKDASMQPTTWDEAQKAFALLWGLLPPQTIHTLISLGDETADAHDTYPGAGHHRPEDFDEDGFLKEIPEPVEPSEAQERAAREWRVGPVAGEMSPRTPKENQAAAGKLPGETDK